MLGTRCGNGLRELQVYASWALRDHDHGVVSVPLQGLRHRAEDVVVSVLGGKISRTSRGQKIKRPDPLLAIRPLTCTYW